jgi:predicted porin
MKKLLPLALLLASAGVAQAQVSLYGLIDLSYGKNEQIDRGLGIPNDDKADFHSGGDDGNSQGNSTTRFGIKGSTDLGSGFKGNFKLESNGITSDGAVNTPFFGRQMWAGISGKFGEVRLGRQDSVPFQTMIDFDFNGAANAASALGAARVAPWLPGRQSRSLQYISSDLGGVTVQVGIQPKGNSPDPDAKDVFSAGAKYTAGPLAAAVAIQTKATSTVGIAVAGDPPAKDFISLAGSYDIKVAKFMVGYATGGAVADGGTGKGISLGVVAPVAGFNIGAHFAKNSDDDFKVDSLELFINRQIFKNTYAYLDFNQSKEKNLDLKTNAYALGVIYTF